jgi:cation transport ATPase
MWAIMVKPIPLLRSIGLTIIAIPCSLSLAAPLASHFGDCRAWYDKSVAPLQKADNSKS